MSIAGPRHWRSLWIALSCILAYSQIYRSWLIGLANKKNLFLLFVGRVWIEH